MNTLMQFFYGFCAAAVFLGFLSMLSPEGTMKKSVKYGFAVTFLCVCVTLFMGLNGISFKNEKRTESKISTSNTLAEKQVEYICAAALTDNKIPFSEIKANIKEAEGIYINEITVYSDFDKEKTEAVIKNTLEVKEVEIIGGR